MAEIKLFALMLFFIPGIAFSEEFIDFKTIDEKTLYHYQQGEWDEVIHWGNVGLKSGYDYYYLRARIGVAYYMLDKYMMAIPHLIKALDFNSENRFVLEYLYYSYMYSGLSNEASKLGYEKNKLLKSVYMETGPTFSNNYDNNGNENPAGKYGKYGAADLYGNNYYTHVGIDFNISKGISWYLGYSNLVIDKMMLVRHPVTFINYDYNYKVYQNELYTNLIIPLGWNWRIMPAFHVLIENYSPLNLTSQGVKITNTSYSDYVGSLNLSRQYKWLNINLSAAYYTIYKDQKQQYGISFSYFPLGNLNLYGQSSVQALIESGDSKLIFHQMLGMKTLNKLWLELFFTLGDMSEMIENNAFVVYNLTDEIKYRLGANFIFTINEHFLLSLRYQFFDKNGYLVQYSANESGANSVKTTPYQTHQILGGIKWNF